MAGLVSIDEFIAKSQTIPVIDVRSESEFRQGHFPGAVNFPVLNDMHRKEVGIAYKNQGRQEAVIKGFDLAGGKFGDFIREVKSVLNNPGHNSELLLYCWRGGMRSAIAEWILTLAGIRVMRLKGGYKVFRNWCLESLHQKKNILVLGGMTGSGKTEILRDLATTGERIIDLESLANHKGSAFGGLGQPPQPSNEHFENMLAMRWAAIPGDSYAWIENESRTIGKNQIPAPVYEQIRNSGVIEIKVETSVRINRILNEYGKFPVQQLAEMTSKLKKRLGGQHLQEALRYLENSDFKNWTKKMLFYYDKTYEFGLEQRRKESICAVTWDGYSKNELINQVKSIGKSFMKNLKEKELSL